MWLLNKLYYYSPYIPIIGFIIACIDYAIDSNSVCIYDNKHDVLTAMIQGAAMASLILWML